MYMCMCVYIVCIHTHICMYTYVYLSMYIHTWCVCVCPKKDKIWLKVPVYSERGIQTYHKSIPFQDFAFTSHK